MPGEYNPPAAVDPEVLARQCQVTFGRKSGPGGQHRNKASTAAMLLHKPTGIEAWASERRSQQENRRVAMFRLRMKLALAVRTAVPLGHQPTALWRSRCREGRMAVNPRHEDFPAILAEALDVVAAHRGDVHNAAIILGCTASQLVKLLKIEPAALQSVNQRRAKRGLHALK